MLAAVRAARSPPQLLVPHALWLLAPATCSLLNFSFPPPQIRVEAGEADAEYDGGDDAEAEGEGEEAEAASSKTVAQALEELEGRLQVGYVCVWCEGRALTSAPSSFSWEGWPG